MILDGKLWQADQWVTVKDKGGLIHPMVMYTKNITLVEDVLRKKHPYPTSLAMAAFSSYYSTPARIDLDITSDIIDQATKKMQGITGPYMGFTRYPLPQNNGNLPLPFFDGNYPNFLIYNIY